MHCIGAPGAMDGFIVACARCERDPLFLASSGHPEDFDTMNLPNKITGANAGGAARLQIRALRAARTAQFWRSNRRP